MSLAGESGGGDRDMCFEHEHKIVNAKNNTVFRYGGIFVQNILSKYIPFH